MSLPLPFFPDCPLPGAQDATDPVTGVAMDRLAEIVRDLLPAMRRRAPHLSEPALLEAVERIAAHRLADEELARHSW
jgi:aminoglycoside N3'-acetyltransferase